MLVYRLSLNYVFRTAPFCIQKVYSLCRQKSITIKPEPIDVFADDMVYYVMD